MQQRRKLSCGTLPASGKVEVNESLGGSNGSGDEDAGDGEVIGAEAVGVADKL